jgi:uncharacterized protein (DUF1330 family)
LILRSSRCYSFSCNKLSRGDEAMKAFFKVSATLVAGIAIGGIAVQALRAQSKPPVYAIAEIQITNDDGYVKEYLPKAREAIKAGGGRIIAASNKPTAGEGEAPKGRVVIQQWDSLEQWQAYRNSAANKAAREIGDKFAKFRIFAVDGVAQ